MSDTLPTTEAYLAARYQALTPGQRIEMACGMWATAVGMARAGLGDAAAGLSETEQRVMLLERLYAGDLAPAVMSQLIAKIRG
ncbi:MAG: hypothetical protein Q8T13_08430 [Acidobacteriota bacterium]|nr:hypothetical protein [Acidobacteriota bacterium]